MIKAYRVQHPHGSCIVLTDGGAHRAKYVVARAALEAGYRVHMYTLLRCRREPAYDKITINNEYKLNTPLIETNVIEHMCNLRFTRP